MEVAKKIFKRYSCTDIIIPSYSEPYKLSIDEVSMSFVGFEDEEGRECDEDGIYLNQPMPDDRRSRNLSLKSDGI